jgi:hypothetical protein
VAKVFEIESKPSDSLALIKLVIDKISLHTRRKLPISHEKQIPELAEFVKQKDFNNRSVTGGPQNPDYMSRVAEPFPYQHQDHHR